MIGGMASGMAFGGMVSSAGSSARKMGVSILRVCVCVCHGAMCAARIALVAVVSVVLLCVVDVGCITLFVSFARVRVGVWTHVCLQLPFRLL